MASHDQEDSDKNAINEVNNEERGQPTTPLDDSFHLPNTAPDDKEDTGKKETKNGERAKTTTPRKTKVFDVTLFIKSLAILTSIVLLTFIYWELRSINDVIKDNVPCINNNGLHRINERLENINRSLMNIDKNIHYIVDRQTAHPLSHLGFPSVNTPRDCQANINTNIDVTGDALKVAVVGEMSTVNLTTGSHSENCFSLMKSSLTCELWSESEASKVQCTRKRKAHDRYELSYTPRDQGRYNLHIKVDGEHIKGSPFFVTAVRKLGKPKKIISGLVGPRGIAFTKKSEVIVAEYEAHRVTILSSSGEHIKSFGSEGKGKGQFFHPCGVAVDDDGNIYVADGKNDRIQKFTPDGEFITAVGRQCENHMHLNYPIGIGLHPRTKMIYVVENKGNRAQMLNPDLTYNNTFGHFHEPKDMAFDSKGNVYVADNENCRIQVFTAEGQFLRRFGRETGIDLNYPTAITIDTYDVIYVLELYTHRVSLFTCVGVAGRCQHLTSFGSEGNDPGEFNQARGMAVDENGTLYVSDQGNKNIQVF